jgi:peptide/nickel transport system permease protein
MRNLGRAIAISVLTSFVLAAIFSDWLLLASGTQDAAGVGTSGFFASGLAAQLDSQNPLTTPLAEWLWATRQTVALGLVTLALGLPLGGLIGTLAGTQPRLFGIALTRAVELTGALPGLILVGLWCVGSRTPTLFGFGAMLAAIRSVGTARLVAEHVRQTLVQDFALAARALGATPSHVLSWHIWPTLRPLLLLEASATAVYALGIDAALGFVGLAPTGLSTWGALLDRSAHPGAATTLLALGCIVAATLALNTLGPVARWGKERRRQARSGGFSTLDATNPR